MALAKNLKGVKGSDRAQILKQAVAETFEQMGQSNYAQAVNQAPNWQGAVDNLNVIGDQAILNSMVGNLFGIIAKQAVNSQKLTPDNIFGWAFNEGEEIRQGGGLSIVEILLNGAGSNDMVDYQTSQDPIGNILFGNSLSNDNQLNVEVNILPFKTRNNFDYQCFKTFNKTIPVDWAELSTLTPIKATEIIEAYYQDVQNSIEIWKYSLGNKLFNVFMPTNARYPATTITNLYEYLQTFLLPELMKMKQLTTQFNGSSNNGQEDPNQILTAYQRKGLISGPMPKPNDPYRLNSSWMGPVLNNGADAEMTIYMSPEMSASIVSLLNLPNFTGNNHGNLDIVADMGQIKSMCGIKVKVTGARLEPTPQTPQGQAVTPNYMGSNVQVLPINYIYVVDDEYLKWAKVYENTWTSDVFGNAMVKTVRAQLGYVPIFKPWKNAVVFQGIPMTEFASLPVTVTNK